jgi:hypothetical protein
VVLRGAELSPVGNRRRVRRCSFRAGSAASQRRAVPAAAPDRAQRGGERDSGRAPLPGRSRDLEQEPHEGAVTLHVGHNWTGMESDGPVYTAARSFEVVRGERAHFLRNDPFPSFVGAKSDLSGIRKRSVEIK